MKNDISLDAVICHIDLAGKILLPRRIKNAGKCRNLLVVALFLPQIHLDVTDVQIGSIRLIEHNLVPDDLIMLE